MIPIIRGFNVFDTQPRCFLRKNGNFLCPKPRVVHLIHRLCLQKRSSSRYSEMSSIQRSDKKIHLRYVIEPNKDLSAELRQLSNIRCHNRNEYYSNLKSFKSQRFFYFSFHIECPPAERRTQRYSRHPSRLPTFLRFVWNSEWFKKKLYIGQRP